MKQNTEKPHIYNLRLTERQLWYLMNEHEVAVNKKLERLFAKAHGDKTGNKKKPDGYVQWYLTGVGYRVQVYDAESRTLDDYEGGNSPIDSAAVVPADEALPDAMLIAFAEQTAADMAKEYGIAANRISRDTDSEGEEIAMRANRD